MSDSFANIGRICITQTIVLIVIFEVSIKEALHIKHRNPNLNKQLSTQGMSFMLKIFT